MVAAQDADGGLGLVVVLIAQWSATTSANAWRGARGESCRGAAGLGEIEAVFAWRANPDEETTD